MDVSVNGAPARRRVFTTDELRSPLSEIADIDREATELLVLRVHLAGRTRQQIVTEFNQGPVTVTI